MTHREHRSDYDEATTERCERALVTLLGDLGPWRERVYLAGGLAPRYLVGVVPEGARAHVGTTDVDLVIGLALGDETPGRIFRPKGESTGSKFSAFNVRGAQLVRDDFVEHEIEAERLDGGGRSKVAVRVANLLPYTVLKILAFQDRHENKDAYDLVFTLLHAADGPGRAGRGARESAISGHAQVKEALALLEERFRTVEENGSSAYALFLARLEDEEELQGFSNEA